MTENIFLDFAPESISYTSPGSGRGTSNPMRNRISHAEKLRTELETVWSEVKKNDAERLAIQKPVKDGTYIEFIGEPGFALNIKSMENRNEGIKLLNVREYKNENGEEETDKKLIKATVFVPKGKEQFFLNRIKSYQQEETEKGNPKYRDLIETISGIKLAVLESFWIGNDRHIPKENPIWCELWIHDDSSESDANPEQKVRKRLEELNIEKGKHTLEFPERKVILIKANYNHLSELISSVEYIAELRRATELNTFFTALEHKEQIKWAKDLIERIEKKDTNVAVSILDSGLNKGNVLLEIIPDSNVHSYFNDSGNDNDGHGTKMAGVSLYGNLREMLESTEPVNLSHTIESMKIFPDQGENKQELYGYITSDAISALVIQNPNRQRITSMAVSTKSFVFKDGRPSSWSAAIDSTTSGVIDEIYKLFIVSAGNIAGPEKVAEYPHINLSEQIEDPGQSWNAVTVGAYTELDRTDNPNYQFSAKKGGLSPFSRTSVLFDKIWPIKPEIVLEGGNTIKDGLFAFEDENLSLLTTHHDPTEAVFTHINATSAGTAYASWMAAKIQSQYPKAWPETVRGLLIHAAEWTEEMKDQFYKNTGKKGDYQTLLRTCGYGVPSLYRAMETVSNRVNLIVQSEIQPYEKVGSDFKTKDMHLYELPWPKEVLESIYDKDVKLKVTLSYFIEPGPGEKGWKDKYRYASAGLRFDLNGSNDKTSFVKRINKAAREEADVSAENTVNWTLGSENRNVGSIHSDTWIGTGAELATSNYIGVYPVIGWWRERPHLGKWHKKVRYSLIVTLEAPELDVDLLTPILNEIEIRVDTPIETEVEF